MSQEELLNKRIARLEKWSGRCLKALDRESAALEEQYRRTLSELENTKAAYAETLVAQEQRLKGELDAAGKEYAQKKYQLERDLSHNKSDLQQLEETFREYKSRADHELRRMNEEKLNLQISHDRQCSALNDLYQEKMRHLTSSRATLTRQAQDAAGRFRSTRDRYEQEIAKIKEEADRRLSQLKEQAQAKRDGWRMALETLQRAKEAALAEKADTEKRIGSIREEKEKELQSVQSAMTIARDQLEIDKATIVEKAEEDQRRCEAEVMELKEKIARSEKELQDLIVNSDKAKQDSEEAYLREENMIKESVKAEGEKRDYEQKLFEQEKDRVEKELHRLREEYEKKKWQWDNQVRSLLMQKTLQDSEHEAERLRTDREARQVLRTMEAKRDELKQRLSDIKGRHTALTANAEKESELIKQRWNWRRERLWSLWQGRLDTLRKERQVLEEQIEALQSSYQGQRKVLEESETRESGRINEIQGFLVTSEDQAGGKRKQREIQFELEKTRVYAQIKECEALISDWTDRLKLTQDEIAKATAGMGEQMHFLDKLYRDEEQETQLFLRAVQNAMSAFQNYFEVKGVRDAA